MNRRHFLQGLAASAPLIAQSAKKQQHLLYAASPGIRNYEEYGGTGIVVFDIDDNYKPIRRIPTWEVPALQKPENVKGIVASAKSGRVFVTSLNHLVAIDAISGKRIWEKNYEGGCDRLAITPDGKTLYVPQLEGPIWHVVNAANGNVITKIETKSASHNTICSADGKYAVLQTVKTARGAKTLGLDSETGKIYLPTADFEMPAAGATGRPKAKPGTFKILVVSR